MDPVTWQVQIVQKLPKSVGDVQMYLVLMSDLTLTYIPQSQLTTTFGMNNI